VSKPVHSGYSNLQETIRRRAEEIYIRSGRISGLDLANWARAEQEIRQETGQSEPSRRAVVVKVHGVEYVGEYTHESSSGYCPGEFGPGATIPVRFEGDKMFITRPNGVELKTSIVKKVG
jgi:hypothetical protein